MMTAQPGAIGMATASSFNFRPDRVRQISHALHDEHSTCFQRGPAPPLPSMTTLTEYERDLHLPVIFPPDYPDNTLGQIFSDAGLPQLRVAETEKYAHVTFFFNGGREKIFPGEERILVPSPGVATYDLQPEMSAAGVADIARRAIVEGRHRLLVVNFANPDMVGHTGILEAAIKAIETVDRQLSRVTEAAQEGMADDYLRRSRQRRGDDRLWGRQAYCSHREPVPCILPGCAR